MVARLNKISCPIFVANGIYDDVAPVLNDQAIADRIPNATLRTYAGGHGFFAQDPAGLADIIHFL
jgi:3-oxoadipate enol-lactonase